MHKFASWLVLLINEGGENLRASSEDPHIILPSSLYNYMELVMVIERFHVSLRVGNVTHLPPQPSWPAPKNGILHLEGR